MGFFEGLKNSENEKVHLDWGLTEKEAKKRLEKYGHNTISTTKRISPVTIFLSQFKDFMVIILLVSTGISALMEEITEAVTIISIVILNAILGFIQEYRTEKTMEALKELAAPTANVLREGNVVHIPAEEIVPGDLLIIETGDRIPADATLLECSSLHTDESFLTGESVPVEKATAKDIFNNTSKKSEVYMGSIVTSGRGKAYVHSTGMHTEMGKIADMIQNIDEEQTPLQKRLSHLGKYIVIGCLIICSVVSITGFLRGEDLFTMLLAGISLGVAAVPEGLPAIVTIALALGVQRMLKKNALIRKLPAVETLGCASVICSDKTGTLTENKMTVREIFTDGKTIDISGNGFRAEGEFLSNGKKISPLKLPALRLALEISRLCNNAVVDHNSESSANAFEKVKGFVRGKSPRQLEISGDPTEAALIIAAEKGGIGSDYIDNNFTRLDEIPFDSDRKCMSVITRDKKGEVFLYTKGAPDIVIEKCSKFMIDGHVNELKNFTKRQILKQNEAMANNALRVIAVAFKKINYPCKCSPLLENELIYVGLIGMIDPPRKEAIESVMKCRMAGIKPVMITGDHQATAKAVAAEIGIFERGDKVLTGAELEKMDVKQLESVVEKVSVYARVSPKHKLNIVRALKSKGHVVAMTGDGVNDAPAIKEADIGVSMGITGTDVTKEASSMILMDDNFSTIVSAVEEGRVIYNNIRKFIRYMLSCNLGEVLTMFLGMLLGLPLPLIPIQILWVNLVTDGLPAIALGFDPPEKDIMQHPPRAQKEGVFSHGLLGLILFRGILIGLSTLAVFVTMLYFNASVENARTGAFLTLVMTQLIHVFECKSEQRNIFEIPIFNNMLLVLSVICSLAMILGVIYIPVFQKIFETVTLNLNDWVIIMGFSLLGPVVSSFFRRKRS